MLTYPSDPLPHLVCPMDEDTIPPNRFCSAPSLSELPPPHPPLSSITPSCVNDGISGHRRSGRIQGIRAQTPKKQTDTDSGVAQKPSGQNPSPSKRHRESGNMVQVSQTKWSRVESTHGHEKQNEDGFDFSFAAEHQNEQKDQKSPLKKTNISAAENVVEQVSDHAVQDLDTTKCDMDTCSRLVDGHSVESASALKSWVIGPLFQSFKSKVASFTEIVMSPVKLFRANSPPLSMDYPDKLEEGEPGADGTSDGEHSELSNVFHSEAQSESGNWDAEINQQVVCEVEGAQNAQTVAITYSKKVGFDVELSAQSSAQAIEYATKEKDLPDSVPLQHNPSPCVVSEEVSESMEPVFKSSLLLQPSVNLSASHESKLEMSNPEEKPKGRLAVRMKPLPGNGTGDRKKFPSKFLKSEVKNEDSELDVIDVQLSHINSVSSNKVELNTDTDVSPPDGDGRKTESCHFVHQSLQNYLNDNANGRILRPALDTQQTECQLHHDTHSAAGLRRAKRELKLDCDSQDSVKKTRLMEDVCIKDAKKRQLLNVASDGEVSRVLRPLRKEAVSSHTFVDTEEILRPVRKRQAISTRANKKGIADQEVLTSVSEAMNTQTESSFGAMLACSLDKGSGVTEDNQKGNNSKVKPGSSCKRLKTQAELGKPDRNVDNGMDLETTIAITSTKRAKQDHLSEVLVRPDIKQLQNTRKCRDMNKKPLKRKSPKQASSTTKSDKTVTKRFPSALPVEPLEVTATDFNTSLHVRNEESMKMELNQSSKRPKKGFKSSASAGSLLTKQCTRNLKTKENQSQKGKGKISLDPIYFEMTPFENLQQPLPTAPHSLQVNNDIKQLMDGEEKDTVSVAGEAFPSNAESSNHSSIDVSTLRSKGVHVTLRRDSQRRKCRGLLNKTRKCVEVKNSITKDDTHSLKRSLPTCLLRSYSCPEIPSLRSIDTPWTSVHSPQHGRIPTSHQHHSSQSSLAHHAHKSLRRARRHTVCSVEVEREIAPLCLRKEVYPARRSVPYEGASQNLSPSLALSPSTSLSALASCFLSSPLAFLSKKVDSRGAAASPSTCSHASSPSSSSSIYPSSPSTRHLPGFLQRNDSSSVTLDSSTSGIPLEFEIVTRQQSEEEDDGENTSSSSQEFEDVGLREEKALSDSEIKVVPKQEERGKVSSIRIRKALPKPQNNLTPMGLPKPIRLKKKEFSLEEIYTNQNFSKPPESRLETIFEVPLNRRNGSESLFGQRRVKRFLEFLEVGEARKPKKPLVGVGKAGVSSSRTRRGGFPKDRPSLSVQDVDSLLCAKLDQLNLWLMRDEKDS